MSFHLSQPKMSHDMPMGPGTMSPGGMNMGGMDGMPSMHTSFFWGKDVILLFSGWPNHSLPMYILACFFVFFMAAAAEVVTLAQSVKLGPSPVTGAVVQACFYAVKMALAYMVMLAVMSFNLGIFVAALLGHSLGHFVVKVRDLREAGRRPATGDVKI